jgi:hypothetical protein
MVCMTHLLAQARFARDSGLSEDVVVNTFHFATPGAGTVEDALTAATRVRDFYTTVGPGGPGAITSFLSSVLATTGHEVRVYDLAQPKPRVPLVTLLFDRTVEPAGDPLPSEVALVLSYRAATAAGDIKARQRGRLYIGPFMESESGAVVASDARPSTTLMNAILFSGKKLADAAPLGTGVQWSVYSPTTLLLKTVVAVHVDNAWDTQRRRGASATGRVAALKST